MSGFAVPTLIAGSTPTGQQGDDNAAVFRLESLHQGQSIAFEPGPPARLGLSGRGEQGFNTGTIEGFGLGCLDSFGSRLPGRLKVRSCC